MALTEDQLLAGPRGRLLCMAVAHRIAGGVWSAWLDAAWRPGDSRLHAELVAALELVDLSRVRRWQDPEDFVEPVAETVGQAMATEGVELGTATVQVPLHHPVDLAHRVLSLSQVCGDRLTLGVSPGSTDTDYAAFDRDYAERFRTFEHNMLRLRTLLDHGRDADADIAPTEDARRPPLLLGSWGANVERAAREFDGWLASGVRQTTGQIVQAHQRFRAAGGKRAIVCAVRLSADGDLGPTREALERYAEAGFDDAVVLIEPGGPAPENVRALIRSEDAGAPTRVQRSWPPRNQAM